MKLAAENLPKYFVFGAAAVGTALVVGWYVKRRRRELSFHPVGHVTGIFTYPVKSCQGIANESALCTKMGVEHDRIWVILDREDRFITQRSHPSLARIKVALDDGVLTLSADGKDDIKVPLMTSPPQQATTVQVNIFSVVGDGVHASEAADKWISEFLGKDGFRLFQYVPSCRARQVASDKTFGSDAQSHDQVAFPDLCPYLLISEESLAELNDHLDDRVTMTRFRPNIVISGCKAFMEDEWKTIRINGVEFRCLHRCGRCILPTVDPETGILDAKKEPLETLRKFRLVPKSEDPRFGNSPVFGRNLACDWPGVVAVGDAVYASAIP